MQDRTRWRDQPVTRSDVLIAVFTWVALDKLREIIGPAPTAVLSGTLGAALLLLFWWEGRRKRRETGHAG